MGNPSAPEQASAERRRDDPLWAASRGPGDLTRDPLELTREQMRELGYRTIDLLVDQLSDRSIPAMRRGDPAELRANLSRSAPAQPHDWSVLLEQLARDVLEPMSRLAHPGYLAFIPASSTLPGGAR